jgi:protease IV
LVYYVKSITYGIPALALSKSTKWFLIILAILAVIVMGFAAFFVYLIGDWSEETETMTTGGGGKIAVVELRGEISSSENIVRQVKKYREERGIKAILLRIDSPGGAVVPSQEIYEEVRKTRDGGKPVVVSMGSLAASGGYYVSCGASRIVANRGTLTGSIGVVSQFLQLQNLLGKVGIDMKTIKSGKLKDAGSYSRKMNEADEKYFQGLIDEVYRQFVGVVESERNLSHAEVLSIADGRVFTGESAVELGLVDTIGTYEDAMRIAASLGGIEGRPTIVRERKRRSVLDGLTSDVVEGLTSIKQELLEKPVLSYRYPGAE